MHWLRRAKLSGPTVQSSFVNSHSKGWLFFRYSNWQYHWNGEGQGPDTDGGVRGLEARSNYGSHRHFKHSRRPNVVTIPGHPGDDVPVGTMKSILRAAGLEEKK